MARDYLLIREQRFVDEYTRTGSGPDACRIAGYAKDISTALLKRPLIKAAVEQAQAELREQVHEIVSKERLLKEYALVAFSNIADYLDFSADGVRLKNSNEIPRELLSAISEVKVTYLPSGGQRMTFKLHDKLRAGDGICRILGFDAPQKLANADGSNLPAIQIVEIVRPVENASD